MATGCVHGELTPEDSWRSSNKADEFVELDKPEAGSSSLSSQHYGHNKAPMPEPVYESAFKPSLPPKPRHGPPLYRDPPRPSMTGLPPSSTQQQQYHVQPPDVCSLNIQSKPTGLSYTESSDVHRNNPAASNLHSHSEYTEPITLGNKPPFSGTQAWMQVQKTPGNVVGERLSTLQRKLRFLLSQTQRNVVHKNCYNNNITSTFDHDKLMPKEVIGRPSQDKKPPEPPGKIDFSPVYPSQFPHTLSPQRLHQEETINHPGSMQPETIHYSVKDVCYTQDVTENSKEALMPFTEFRDTHKRITGGPTTVVDSGDTSDQYKSSSESGHGTMHSSSIRDSKSMASVRSSRVSGASHLDTSLDSDQSASGALWENSNRSNWTQNAYVAANSVSNQIVSEYNEDKIIEQNRPKTRDELSINECLSRQPISLAPPPPPPFSPPPLSGSANSSPAASPKAKYKLSLSTPALNSYQNKPTEEDGADLGECSHDRHGSPPPATKSNSASKASTSRNQPPAVCRQRCSKNKGYSSRTSGHGYNCNKVRALHVGKHSSSTLALPSYSDYADPEWTSTTTGLDGESLLEDPDDLSSDMSMSTSTLDPDEMTLIRKQLEGLETVYSEILHLLGVKNSPSKGSSRLGGNPSEFLRHRYHHANSSIRSVTARSSNSRSTASHIDKRGIFEKRRGKERNSSGSRRLQRLESHVVTLARSVAHLSSEMRTQHLLAQELEHMRQDVTWVQERLRLLQLAQGCPGNYYQEAPQRDFFRKDVTELLNPCRAKKLTKFFGDEPPLIRQFLKRLGYEKYASNFESEKIGILELPYLTEERLQKIGVPMGPRMRILQGARTYCQQNQYKVYIV